MNVLMGESWNARLENIKTQQLNQSVMNVQKTPSRIMLVHCIVPSVIKIHSLFLLEALNAGHVPVALCTTSNRKHAHTAMTLDIISP